MALEDGPNRLHEDHDNAKRLAQGLADLPGISIDVDRVVTNIVIFDISGTGKPSAEIVGALGLLGVLAVGFGAQIRMVTHLDVSADDVDATIESMSRVLDS